MVAPRKENKMNNVTSLSKAYYLAAVWHSAQKRKGKSAEPYINHLLEVADLVNAATDGSDVDLTIAAILHDAIEDAGITVEVIAETFGTDVANLVVEVTDDKSLKKKERKRLQVVNTPKKSNRAKMIKLADKTSNIRAITNSPPPWPLRRKKKYLAWARDVVVGARGVNPRLEKLFDEAASALESKLTNEVIK